MQNPSVNIRSLFGIANFKSLGEVAERLNAPVLKTGKG